MRLQQADAAVPAQHRIGEIGPQVLGLLEELEGVLEGRDRAVSLVALHVRLRRALPRHADVIDALVRVGQALEGLDGLLEQADLPGREPVGQGESQELPGLGVRRVDVDHVPADALGLFGLIQIAVVLGLGDRSVEARVRQSFQFEAHPTSPRWRSPVVLRYSFGSSVGCGSGGSTGSLAFGFFGSPDILLATQRIGSKYVSATRSLSGMMPLSVM